MSVSKEAEAGEEERHAQVYLTQAFEVAYPAGIEAGSTDAYGQDQNLSRIARSNVVSNIQSFRELKADKKI